MLEVHTETTDAQLEAARQIAGEHGDAQVWGHDDGAVRVKVEAGHWHVAPDGTTRRL